MRPLVNDFTTHPLLPGAVLASVMGDPAVRESQPLDLAALVQFNKANTPDILAYFQSLGAINEEQGAKLIRADTEFVNAYKRLQKRIPEVADVTF